MSQQHKFFPAWLVVASGFVIMTTCYTIFVNCMSLFQPLIVSVGWRSAFLVLAAICMVAACPSRPIPSVPSLLR